MTFPPSLSHTHTPPATVGDPCYGSVKTVSLIASCSAAPGGAPGGAPPVFARGVAGAAGAPRRVLRLNKSARPQVAVVAGAAGGTWLVVDESTGFGPAAGTTVGADGSIALAPFAAGIVTLLS